MKDSRFESILIEWPKEKIFFDTEFTGLRKDTTLISIGLVSESGPTFYAECGDFNTSQVDPWVLENVVSNLRFYDKEGKGWCNCDTQAEGTIYAATEVFGHSGFVSKRLAWWLSRFGQVEMWSDCLAYDWVLFRNLWAHPSQVPENIYYIPFDICTLFKLKGIDPDIDRELFAGMQAGSQKHNALWDAQVIKACYVKAINCGSGGSYM